MSPDNLLGAERLDPAGDEAHRIEAEAGFDRLDLHGEQPEEMGAVAGGPGGADGDPLDPPVDPVAEQVEPARGQARLAELRDQPLDQQAERFGDRLGGGDRLGEAQDSARRLLGDDRLDRLAGAAERLVEAGEQGLAEAALERASRQGQEVADRLEPEPAGGGEDRFVDPKRGERKRREGGRLTAGGARAAGPEAGEGVGRAGGAGDRDPGGEAGARAEGEDPAAHLLLAAEQVGDPAEVEEQAVGGRGRGARGPAAGGEEGEAVEDGRIGGRIVVADVETRDERARLGDGHSRVEAERPRLRRGGGDLEPVAGPAGEEEGLP